jgi:hypothetical protein
LPGVDPVRVGDHAGLLGLAEHAREADGGDRTAVGQQVAQHLAGADAGELVHVSDEEEMGSWGHGLDQLVGEEEVEHGGLVHDHQVGVQGAVLVVGRVAAGLEFQEAVDGGGLGAGEFGESLGGAAGRGGEDDLGLLRRASSTIERTVKDLPQPGPPVRTATFFGEGEPDGGLLLGGELHARTVPLSQASALSQATSWKPGMRSASVRRRRRSWAARESSARWKGTR